MSAFAGKPDIRPDLYAHALKPGLSNRGRLEPVKVIQVRPFKATTFLVGQSDSDGVFMVTDEFERGLVIVVDSFVGEGFIRTADGDVVTVLAPTDIDLVRGDTIKICERALDGSAVDIDGVHFQWLSVTGSRRGLQNGYLPTLKSASSFR